MTSADGNIDYLFSDAEPLPSARPFLSGQSFHHAAVTTVTTNDSRLMATPIVFLATITRNHGR
jgi:hypothetical protein